MARTLSQPAPARTEDARSPPLLPDTGFDRRPAGSIRLAPTSAVKQSGAAGIVVSVGALLQRTLADTGLLRTNVDNVSGATGMKVGRSLDTAAEGKAFFEQRHAAASTFLRKHGLQGQVVAKLVKADQITVAGHAAVQHAEWQFFLVPTVDVKKARVGSAGTVFLGGRPPELPGLLDERRLTEWVKQKTGVTGVLRSEHNPLFLGRLNLGEGGMGVYKAVPEFAEFGAQKYDSRKVVGLVVVDSHRVRAAIDAGYARLPGEWGQSGTCQQGVMVTARSLGLDEDRVARQINGLWLTRLKFGRTGSSDRQARP